MTNITKMTKMVTTTPTLKGSFTTRQRWRQLGNELIQIAQSIDAGGMTFTDAEARVGRLVCREALALPARSTLVDRTAEQRMEGSGKRWRGGGQGTGFQGGPAP